MGKRPTIHDVARHAGVGVKTVSRVINGERAVSDLMRTRVNDSIRALDYRPNAAARVLRRQVARSIGFVCEDIAEPVQAQLAKAIETVAARQDCAMTVSLTHHDPVREQAALESLLSRQTDGVLLWPTGVGSRYLRRLVGAVPLVCVDRPIDGVETDTVFCDNHAGAAEAVRFLLGRGHRRIAFVGDQTDLFTQQERLAGYQHGLSTAGIAADPSIIFQRRQGVADLGKQLAHWRASPASPTAVFAASSLSAATLLQASARLIPDNHLEIVGFDDFPFADVVGGGISVVAQDVGAIGTAAAEILFRRLALGHSGFTHTRVPPRLIDRR